MLDNRVETKVYAVTEEVSEYGRTRVNIVCPFCGTHTWAHVWSLAGSGKTCPG